MPLNALEVRTEHLDRRDGPGADALRQLGGVEEADVLAHGAADTRPRLTP